MSDTDTLHDRAMRVLIVFRVSGITRRREIRKRLCAIRAPKRARAQHPLVFARAFSFEACALLLFSPCSIASPEISTFDCNSRFPDFEG